jgi:hypothetical protein
MNANNIFHVFLSKNNKFYNEFNSVADHILASSELFLQMTKTDNEEERNNLALQIKKHENTCDDITHDIYKMINQTFITPFRKEDIYNIATALDDVQDCIYASSQRVILLMPGKFNENYLKMIEMIVLAAEELKSGLSMLNHLKSQAKIKECCERISVIESNADHAYRLALTALFKEEKNAIEIIKWKEILEFIEETIDLTESVADVIKSVMVKNS